MNIPTPLQNDLGKRIEDAVDKYGRMSCAQTLAVAYSDLVGMEQDRALQLTEGFGSGMGKRQTCGAVTVMLMLAGLAGKGSRCEGLMNAFEKELGSTMCRDLMESHGPDHCPDCLRCAGRLLNERVFSGE